MRLSKFTPLAGKSVLILISGLMWCGVGIMLLCFSHKWLSVLLSGEQVFFYSIGFLVAMPVHHFGFLKLADRNIRRLLPLNEKKNVFSFMTPKSYITVIIMVAMGITLRHSAIPKRYLSIIYTGIGLALFLSGIRYMRTFMNLTFKPDIK